MLHVSPVNVVWTALGAAAQLRAGWPKHKGKQGLDKHTTLNRGIGGGRERPGWTNTTLNRGVRGGSDQHQGRSSQTWYTLKGS